MASGGFAEWLGTPGTNAEWLGVWGRVASLVSLAVSGYAAWQITVVRRKVSRQILFKVQAPKLVLEVAETAKWLAESVNAADVSEQDREVKIRGCLLRLSRHETSLTNEVRQIVKTLTGLVKEYKNQRELPSAIMSDIIIEFRVLGDVLPDMVEAKHIGGTDGI